MGLGIGVPGLDARALLGQRLGRLVYARPANDTIAEIQVTPFACLFAILILVVVLFSMEPFGPTWGWLDRPPGFQKEFIAISVPHQITISVGKRNTFVVDGVVTDGTYLRRSIANAMIKRCYHKQSMHIGILAARDAPWYSIIEVLDAARWAGDDDATFIPPAGSHFISQSVGATARLAISLDEEHTVTTSQCRNLARFERSNAGREPIFVNWHPR